MSAFVPANVISITDGQIFLETSLFNAGIPSRRINAGISGVARRWFRSQDQSWSRASPAVSRTDLAQYRELAAFAQFAPTWTMPPASSSTAVPA